MKFECQQECGATWPQKNVIMRTSAVAGANSFRANSDFQLQHLDVNWLVYGLNDCERRAEGRIHFPFWMAFVRCGAGEMWQNVITILDNRCPCWSHPMPFSLQFFFFSLFRAVLHIRRSSRLTYHIYPHTHTCTHGHTHMRTLAPTHRHPGGHVWVGERACVRVDLLMWWRRWLRTIYAHTLRFGPKLVHHWLPSTTHWIFKLYQ